MSRARQYIADILRRLPLADLPGDVPRESFGMIRDRIVSAEDVQSELRALYKVRNFSGVALSLLWIAEKVENDPTLVEATAEEDSLVLRQFQESFGRATSAAGTSSLLGGFPDSSPEHPAMIAPDAEPPAEVPVESKGGAAAAGSTAGGASSSGESGNEEQFGMLFEKFTESVQSGSEDRDDLLNRLVEECTSVIQGSYAEDYKQFCTVYLDFLQYVTANQFLDDVRVMNLCSNVLEPVMQWSQARPESRAGLLDQALEIIRDFKTMFE